jgi:hypothetical protein
VVRRLLNQHKSRGEERLLAAFAFGACEPDQLWMGGLLSIVGIGGLASMSQKHPKHLVVGLLMCAFFAIYGLRELVIQLLAPRIRYYLSRAEIRAEGPLYRKSITLSEVREVRLSTAHGTLPWKPRYASIPPFTRCKLIGPAGRMTVYSHSHKAISAIVRRCRNAHVVHRRF